MKIKFCGLFREQDIDFANALKPDFVGFIFARQSKRFVDFTLAKALKSRLDSAIKAVGVFVDENVECVCEAVDSGIIDIVQLHGNENNGYIGALRDLSAKYLAQNLQIIKAIKVHNANSLLQSQNLNADFILLDSPNAGSGKAFDWRLLAQNLQDFTHDFQTRFFLAGGINAENIQNAIALNPFCIDISSGIESNGVKDFAKMRQIIQATRTRTNNE